MKQLYGLQLFAEKNFNQNNLKKKNKTQEKSALKYTDDDLNRIISEKFAKWKKQQYQQTEEVNDRKKQKNKEQVAYILSCLTKESNEEIILKCILNLLRETSYKNSSIGLNQLLMILLLSEIKKLEVMKNY